MYNVCKVCSKILEMVCVLPVKDIKIQVLILHN